MDRADPSGLDDLRPRILVAPHGPRLRAGLVPLALCLAGTASAQELIPPSILSCTAPAYPAGVDAGTQRVEALLEVDRSGRVVRTLDWVGNAPFLEAVQATVGDCRFEPATLDGEPIAVELPFAWEFPEPAVTLSGVVRARGDRTPLVGLTVRAGDRTATTDADGAYAFRNLGEGAWTVGLVSADWRVPDVSLDVNPDDRITLDLWAFRTQAVRDELVATYDRVWAQPTRSTLETDAVRAIPGSLGDPVRALQSQPGFARSPFDSGWLLVRGGDSDDTGLYLDGVRIPLLFHMGGFTSVVHPEMTSNVRFWTGSPPSRYRSTSGAVDVTPTGPPEAARAVAGVNVAWAHAFAETPTAFGGVAIAARRSYLDGAMALALGSDAAQIAPTFSDLQARVHIGDSSLTLLSLTDAFNAPSISGGILTVSQRGWQAQGRIPIELETGTVSVTPWLIRTTRALTGDVSQEQALVETSPGVRIGYRSRPTAPVRFDTGVEAEVRNWQLSLDTRDFQSPGARVDPWMEGSIGKRIVMTTGVRFDTLLVREQLPRAELSPRTSVQWWVSDRTELHAEVGRYHGTPATTLLVGLPEGAYLPLEQSNLFSAGWGTESGPWHLGIDLYQRNLADLSGIELDGTVGTSTGRARGLELSTGWRTEAVSTVLLYHWTESIRLEEGQAQAVREVTDQPQRIQALASWRLPREWMVSGRFRAGSGFPRTFNEELGAFVPEQAYDLLTQTYRVLPNPTASRLPAYYSLDLKASRTFQMRRWHLDVWVDIQNLTNRRVPEPLITGFGEPIPSYGYGLPILPLFGVEGIVFPRKVKPPAATDG